MFAAAEVQNRSNSLEQMTNNNSYEVATTRGHTLVHATSTNHITGTKIKQKLPRIVTITQVS